MGVENSCRAGVYIALDVMTLIFLKVSLYVGKTNLSNANGKQCTQFYSN